MARLRGQLGPHRPSRPAPLAVGDPAGAGGPGGGREAKGKPSKGSGGTGSIRGGAGLVSQGSPGRGLQGAAAS